MSEDRKHPLPAAANDANDISTLYDWADLKDAPYRDFSASRREHRAQVRTAAMVEVVPGDEQAATPVPQAYAAEAPLAGPQRFLVGHDRPTAGHASASHGVASHGLASQSLASQSLAAPASRAQPEPERPAERPFRAPQVDPYSPHIDPLPAAPSRPARPAAPSPPPIQIAPTPTRWDRVRGVFDPQRSGRDEIGRESEPDRGSGVILFSIAGGSGKTSLAASLGRCLSARGEKTLLISTAPHGLLPFYFGSTDWKPGVVRTFAPPEEPGQAAVQLLSLEPDPRQPGRSSTLQAGLARCMPGSERVLIDLETGAEEELAEAIQYASLVLVPLLPDLQSMMSTEWLQRTFAKLRARGISLEPYYVLNQFENTLPLHLDVRDSLRRDLGDRLLPFELRRTPLLMESLAEGMTIIDYAPNSPAARDFLRLAEWLRDISAPAGARGDRWSER